VNGSGERIERIREEIAALDGSLDVAADILRVRHSTVRNTVNRVKKINASEVEACAFFISLEKCHRGAAAFLLIASNAAPGPVGFAYSLP